VPDRARSLASLIGSLHNLRLLPALAPHCRSSARLRKRSTWRNAGSGARPITTSSGRWRPATRAANCSSS
jgi:hypothetical protein